MVLSPLVDRQAEWARLTGHWSAVLDGDARMVLVSGRRRVGKTFLLLHLAEHVRATGGQAVVFTPPSRSAVPQQLDALSGALARDLDDDPWQRFSAANWEAAIDHLLARAARRPLLVVLDEAPYITAAYAEFPSILQARWDRVRAAGDPPRIMLVLAGSAIGAMQELTDRPGAPLAGRFDGRLSVAPFDLPAAAQILDQLEPDEVISAYAACGGYPLHLRAWDQTCSVEHNLGRLAFSPGGVLLEAGHTLELDLPGAGGYAKLLHAVGSGTSAVSQMERKIDQRIERPLDHLVATGYVRGTRPVGARDRAPRRYDVPDAFLRFWLDLLWADAEQIEGGLGKAVRQARQERWQRHLGWVFEEQARCHAIRLATSGALADDIIVGEWWQDRPEQIQLDVAAARGRAIVLAGEAKWSATSVTDREVDRFRRRVARIDIAIDAPRLLWWSRTAPAAPVGIDVYTAADMVTG